MNVSHTARRLHDEVMWLARVSRFPYFWSAVGGFFWIGVVYAGLFYPVSIVPTVLVMLWFIVPGNVFLVAINDAFDYETDKLNPRKQSIEMVSPREAKAKLIVSSLISLATALLLLPFTNELFNWMFVLWVLIIFAYNIEPLRFKAIPVMSTMFGAVGHYTVLTVLGFVFVSGMLPSVHLFILSALFVTAMQIASGDAVDIEYDRQAGIRTLGVYLGSANKTMVCAAGIFFASTLYLLYLGAGIGSVASLIFPAYCLYEVFRNQIALREVMIYRNLTVMSIVFFVLVGWFYLNTILL